MFSFSYRITRLSGEFAATAILLALGCLGCACTSDKECEPLRTSVSFGLVTMILMHCFGYVSGAHANPTVTVACWIIGYISYNTALMYVVAQFAGAMFGYYILTLIMPESILYDRKPGLCMTIPKAILKPEQGFGIEFILTSIMLLGWCALWDRRNYRFLESASLRTGFIMAFCCLAGGNFTGASMNPARTLAPAFFHDDYQHMWMYFSSQFIAAIVTPILWVYLFTPRVFLIEGRGGSEGVQANNMQSRNSANSARTEHISSI